MKKGTAYFRNEGEYCSSAANMAGTADVSELVGRNILDFTAYYHLIGQETDNDKGQDGYPASEYEINFLNERKRHQLKCEIIAEGIENQLQADLLKHSNCNLGQGYFYNRPLTNDKIEKVLRKSLIN